MQTNMMTVDVMIWAFRDWQGNEWVEVTGESSDVIQVTGLVNMEGNSVYFESEAYHVEQWCRENGIRFRHEKRTIEFGF
jgi:hypothetical protein